MPERKRKKAQVERSLCVACGCCEKVCPLNAVRIDQGLFAVIDRDRCVGCGKCAKECPASVIEISEVPV